MAVRCWGSCLAEQQMVLGNQQQVAGEGRIDARVHVQRKNALCWYSIHQQPRAELYGQSPRIHSNLVHKATAVHACTRPCGHVLHRHARHSLPAQPPYMSARAAMLKVWQAAGHA
jgi:hypothetical protein